jgi:CRISPR/Cas system-associated exonuclease Cas4 (RecB family)
VKSQEEHLKHLGYDFFVPLQKNVRDFGMKKILLKKHLRNVSKRSATSNGVRFSSEKWFESKDKLIAGIIDLVIETENESEIIDFKTGAITQDVLDDEGEIFSDIKEEYKEQLKLYAYLYFETNGKFPTQLSLVDLAKQRFNIDFTESECNFIFEEAKELLKATNESISSEKFIANPSQTNCRYCLYRPACSFFLKHLETDYSFGDVSGSILNVVKYQNGNVSVFLESGERKITVTSFKSEKYHELSDRQNEKINVFNLRKEATEFVYSATKTTIIYE